jgi:hypothetical protein
MLMDHGQPESLVSVHLLRIRQAVKRFSASPQVGAASEMVLAVFEPNALVFGSAKDGEATAHQVMHFIRQD